MTALPACPYCGRRAAAPYAHQANCSAAPATTPEYEREMARLGLRGPQDGFVLR